MDNFHTCRISIVKRKKELYTHIHTPAFWYRTKYIFLKKYIKLWHQVINFFFITQLKGTLKFKTPIQIVKWQKMGGGGSSEQKLLLLYTKQTKHHNGPKRKELLKIFTFKYKTNFLLKKH